MGVNDDLLDPMIFKMKAAAEKMIAGGDDYGHLALFWINEWIRDPRTVLDEDEYEKGRMVRRYVDAHPLNFPWAFNSSGELGEFTHSRAAIEKAYKMAGGRL